MLLQVTRGVARAVTAPVPSAGTAGTPRPYGARYQTATPAVRDPQDLTGAMVLDTLDRLWFSRYAALPPHASTFLPLWAAHTWYREKDGTLALRVTPRAWILSKKPGGGKTLVLQLLALVSARVNGIELEPTAPGLKMILSQEKGTAFLDEGDILFGQGGRKSAVRAIMNGGYSRVGISSGVTTAHGGRANRMNVFGPIAMAGLDRLETGTGDALEALLSRGVKIRMDSADREHVRSLPKLEADLVSGRAERDAGAGRDALEWMAAATYDTVTQGSAWDTMPQDLDPRAQQIWEPLKRVALAAGGDWPDRCDEAALALSGTGASSRAAHVARLLAGFGKD